MGEMDTKDFNHLFSAEYTIGMVWGVGAAK